MLLQNNKKDKLVYYLWESLDGFSPGFPPWGRSASRARQGMRMIPALRLFFRRGGRKRRSQSDGQARHARSDRERLRQGRRSTPVSFLGAMAKDAISPVRVFIRLCKLIQDSDISCARF